MKTILAGRTTLWKNPFGAKLSSLWLLSEMLAAKGGFETIPSRSVWNFGVKGRAFYST
jgi:hypothetical protein